MFSVYNILNLISSKFFQADNYTIIAHLQLFFFADSVFSSMLKKSLRSIRYDQVRIHGNRIVGIMCYSRLHRYKRYFVCIFILIQIGFNCTRFFCTFSLLKTKICIVMGNVYKLFCPMTDTSHSSPERQ